MQYSSNPVPLVNTFEQAISGGSSIVNGKDPVTKVRGAVTTAGAVGSILGVPGASQGSQLIKGLIPPANSKTPEETAYNKKLKAESDAKTATKNAFMPTYDKVQALITSGDQIGADALVQKMSDTDYETYKAIRTSEREKNSAKLKTLVNTDPSGAVKFVRSQNQAEQDRLLKNMSDDEYKLYEQGKSTTPAEVPQKSTDSKPVSMIKAGAKALFGAKTAFADTVANGTNPAVPQTATTTTSGGVAVRNVPDSWQKTIDSAVEAHPELKKYAGLIPAILMQESSMGSVDSSYNPKIGESAWLGGVTNVMKDELKRNGFNVNTDTQAGVINAIADYLTLKSKVTNPGSKTTVEYKDPVNLYLQRYKTQAGVTLKPDDIKRFRAYVDYYKNNS